MCGRSREQTGGISWTGLCRDCALDAVAENLEALDTKQGYPFVRYVRGMMRYAQTLALDALPPSGQTDERGS